MLKVILSIVIIFFTVSIFLFSEKEPNPNGYINNITAVTDKTQTMLDSGNLPQGYGISKDGIMNFDDKYFGYLYYEIEKNPSQYASQKVVITGFVYKDPDFQDNELKVARIQLPKCGSEEEQILGLMCIAENASDFENDEWVTVKGTLIVKSYINPMTKSERYSYYLETESIEKIQRNSDYTI